MKLALFSAAVLSLAVSGAQAAEIHRDAAPGAMIATSVLMPPGSSILYLSGMTPPSIAAAGQPPAFGDTKTQAMGVFTRMGEALKAQGMSFADVVMMRVYLVADPDKGGVMDFAGMNDAYRTFFANPGQPNQPARVTVQVSKLANPAFLVEIEAQAAKAP
jgi:enamine deaminase RidA (YjgF/YER057c/UK114 family)